MTWKVDLIVGLVVIYFVFFVSHLGVLVLFIINDNLVRCFKTPPNDMSLFINRIF